jgi:hypothetical protein
MGDFDVGVHKIWMCANPQHFGIGIDTQRSMDSGCAN